MSEVKITVDVEKLRETVTKFQSCKEQLATAYGQMSTEVLAVNSTWNGAASDAFVDRFSELAANIRTSDATIEQAIVGLKNAAAIYEQVAGEVSSDWSGASESSGFQG